MRQFPILIVLIPLVLASVFQFYLNNGTALQIDYLAFFVLLIGCALFFERQLAAVVTFRISFLVLFFFIVGLLNFSLNDNRQSRLNISRFTQFQAIYTGIVIEAKAPKNGNQQLIVSEISKIDHGKLVTLSGSSILQTIDLNRKVLPGDILMWNSQLKPIQNLNNPGEFDAEYYYGSKEIGARSLVSEDNVVCIGEDHSISSFFARWRFQLSAEMEEHLDGVFLGIAQALILGDKSHLDHETMRVFSNTGSMHVLAVSGLHIGLLLLIIQWLLSRFARFISKRKALLIALVLIWVYGMISGASPSVMRAVVMFTILSGSQFLFRRNSHLNGLFLSALILIIHNPLVIFDIGFQLSYAAMLGIFLLYEPILNLKSFQLKSIQWIWEGTAVGLAATIFTFPLTLFWFYQFPNYFLLANIGVMIFGFFVLLLGLMFLISSWIPFVSKIVVFIFSISIIALVDWVTWIDSLPGAVSGGFHLNYSHVIIAYLILIFWIFSLNKSAYFKLIAMASSLLFICWISFSRNQSFSKSEWMVLRSKELILIVNTPQGSIAFYELKRGENTKIPRELSSYLIYSGQKTKTIPIQHSTTQFKINNKRFELNKKQEGWQIVSGKQTYFYRNKGIPVKGENPQLMSLGLQFYLNPNTQFEVFRSSL